MVVIMAAMLLVGLFGSYAMAAPKLIVKDAAVTPNEVFVVNDDALGGPAFNVDILAPNNGLVRLSSSSADATAKSGRFVLRHYTNAQLPVYLFGAASTAGNNFVALGGGSTIGNAATQLDFYTAANTTTAMGTSRMVIKSNGYVGIGTASPAYLLDVAGQIRVQTTTYSSSRTVKDNIVDLKSTEAMEALKNLNPVKFTYKTDPTVGHIGFIAEDVPNLVAQKNRDSIDPMDVVAVLTKVVKEQNETIEALAAKVNMLEKAAAK